MSDKNNFEEYRRMVLNGLGVEYETEDLRNFELFRNKVLDGLDIEYQKPELRSHIIYRQKVLDGLGVSYENEDIIYYKRWRAKVLDGLGIDYEEEDIINEDRWHGKVIEKFDTVWKTVSGSIASFSDGADDYPMKSVVAEIVPIQDLHGYDKPWSGGAGKNKLPISCESETKGGVTYTVYKNSSGAVTRIHAEGTSTSAHSFSVVQGRSASNPFTIKAGRYWFKGLSNGVAGSFDFNIRKTGASTDTVQITSKVPIVLTEDTDFQSCYLYVYNGKTINLDIYPMVWSQSESSDDYEPYSNICPISGRTEVVTSRCGVNVWDEEWEAGGINTSGQETTTSGYYRSKNYTAVLPNTTYYFKVLTTMSVMFYDSNKDFIEWTTANNAIVTTPSNCRYLRFRNTTANAWTPYANDISINYPSTDTDYHAYDGHTYTTDLGRTVYGGTLDVVSGEGEGTMAMVDLGTLNWGKNGNIFYARINDLKWVAGDIVPNAFCSVFKIMSKNNWSITPTEDSLRYDNTDPNIYVRNSTYADAQSFKASVVGQTLAYEIQTPTPIYCEPTEIKTLKGNNNVWADSGDVEVTYKAKIGDKANE